MFNKPQRVLSGPVDEEPDAVQETTQPQLSNFHDLDQDTEDQHEGQEGEEADEEQEDTEGEWNEDEGDDEAESSAEDDDSEEEYPTYDEMEV